MNDHLGDRESHGLGNAIKTGVGAVLFLLTFVLFLGFGMSAGLQGWRLWALALAGGTFVGAGAVLGAPAVAGLYGRSVGGLYYPEAAFDEPQPIFGPAEALAATGRYREALEAFEQLLEEFPGAYRAYACMIEILLYELHDRDRAAAVLARAGKALSDPGEKAELQQLFAEASEEIARQQTRHRRIELAPDEQDT